MKYTYAQMPKCRRSLSALRGNDSPTPNEHSDDLRMSTLQDSLFPHRTINISWYLDSCEEASGSFRNFIEYSEPSQHCLFPSVSHPLTLFLNTKYHIPVSLRISFFFTKLREWIRFHLLWNSHIFYSFLKMPVATQFKYTAFPSVVDLLYFHCSVQWSTYAC